MDGRPFGVYAMPATRSVCGNPLLLQDWGLIPWAFHRVYGCRAVAVFGKTGECPYRDTYMHGLEAEFLTTEREQMRAPVDFVNRCLNFIYKNYEQMDLLLFFGLAPAYLAMAELYKQMRPDGKIWLKVNADSWAADRFQANKQECRTFLGRCDLITAETMEMRRMLSLKWRRPVAWAPRGFCALEGQEAPAPVAYTEKKNIILTAGRIAAPDRERPGRDEVGEWKGGHLMLAAFALAAEKLPGWNLHILGPVEAGARPALRAFFEKYPGLSDRIRLLEPPEEDEAVFSRPLFWEECRQAKVFAYGLEEPQGECGNVEDCPDVFCEAALRGCFSLTRREELVRDLTEDGKFGIAVAGTGAAGLAGALMEICGDQGRLERTCGSVQEFVRDHMDYERMVRKMTCLLRLGEGEKEIVCV